MRMVRFLALAPVLLTGCFSEPSSGASGGGGSTGSTTSVDATSSGSAETSGESSTGSTSSTGFGSGFDSSSSETTAGPVVCGDDARCLPEFAGWDGPFEIITSDDPALPCPNMAPPAWRSNGDIDDVVCDCECGSIEASCALDVLLSDSACGVTPVEALVLPDGACTGVAAVGDFAAGVELVNSTIVDESCPNPSPPDPTFAASVAACPAQITGECDEGSCVSGLLGPMSRMCIARPGTDAPPCPEPFSTRSVVADSATSEGMDCDECGCEVLEASCDGIITGFFDPVCMSPGSMPEPAEPGACVSLSPMTVEDLAGIRYDATVVGTCQPASATVPAQGEPTLDGVRTLCCI